MRNYVATIAICLSAAWVQAHGPGCLCDPVVTFTNGMRLPSTTAMRSHNVYWLCDPFHFGYCEGCYYSPCRNDIRGLGARPHGRFLPPCTPLGPTSSQTVHTVDGMEPAEGESLGTIPVDSSLPIIAPGEAPTPELSQPGWVESLEATAS